MSPDSKWLRLAGEKDNENAGQQITVLSPALRALKNLRMQLQDLTVRNRLINFRHTKTGSLRIIDEPPNLLALQMFLRTICERRLPPAY